MEGVLSSSKELNEKLLKCEIYKNYVDAKNQLIMYPQYKKLADNFRKKQVELESRKSNGGGVDVNEEFALSNEYADICLIKVCNDFFQAEMKLLELINAVYSQICEGLVLDMEFMD